MIDFLVTIGYTFLCILALIVASILHVAMGKLSKEYPKVCAGLIVFIILVLVHLVRMS